MTPLARLAGAGLSDPEIAQRLGVSARTVLRHRKAQGIPSQRTPLQPSHGTLGRYRQGCHEACCRPANADAARALREAYNRATMPRRIGVRWTPAEDAQLLEGTGSLISRARALGRSYDAARRRLDQLRAQGGPQTA